jgi:GNAT superfamily N-acetyltransferase
VTAQVPPVGATEPDHGPGAPTGMSSPTGVRRRPYPQPRTAVRDDVGEILRLVRELADYERSLPEVSATAEDLTELLFGTNTPSGTPAAHCHVIDADAPAGGLAGLALWFLNASTWVGRHGIYLEDLYVSPEYRGRGYGRDLMATLAGICVERGYRRLEWSVLDWNTPAIDFYASLGARPMDEWTVHRISGRALEDLAATRS